MNKPTDGRLELVQRAFLPRDASDKIERLGSAVADLVDTIDHNIEHGDADPYFQRRVMYHGIPRSAVAGFRKPSGAQTMGLLVKLDRWLAQQSTAADTALDPKEPLVRLGVGIHYFEEDLEPPTQRKTES